MTQPADPLANLTEPQRRAVTHIDGPLLVLAGPGSGKTRVITQRVAYLIEQGIAPYHILAITFTNKAAKEMRRRLDVLRLPAGSTMCTFHSLAARLLRQSAEEIGLARDFSIYDETDQKAVLRNIMKELELAGENFPPARMLAHISGYKNGLRTPRQITESAEGFQDKIIARVYAAYQERLKKNNALDFDDLLMKLAFLLRDNTQLRDRLNDRFRYVLVDEYQDTNHCQYQIARGLTLRHRNLCVTGDPDQSIYAWRGADIGNILAFEEDYPDAVVIRLEENFRSTPQVLKLADQLIRRNIKRKAKQLFSNKRDGVTPQLIEYADERDEADGMVEWIKSQRRQGLEYRQMAVFYRVNSLSRALEEALIREHIPYQILRGIEFFRRREIKDVLAYLRLLTNPADRVAFQRVVNRPARGIGTTTVNRLLQHCDRTDRDTWQVLGSLDDVASIGAAAKTRLRKFADLIRKLKEQITGPVEPIMQLVYTETGLDEALADDTNASANVDELINSAAQYDAIADEPTLADYLQQIALLSDTDSYDNQAGIVSLMTLHAAKGLEFPSVRIVAVEDGLIPHSRSANDEAGLEEERRLLFVGMTRAEQALTLTYTRHRMVRGTSLATIRSEFVRGLEGLELHCADTDLDNDCDSGDDHDSHHGDCSSNADGSDWDSDCNYQYDSDSDPYDETSVEQISFKQGQLVRHPTYGLGRIQQVILAGTDSRVVVRFNTGPRKTLYLKYAGIQPVGI